MKSPCFSTWTMMLAVSLLYLAFLRLRLCCLYIHFVSSFYCKWMLNFVRWFLTKKPYLYILWGLPSWIRGKKFTCQCKRYGFNPWVGKLPWGRKWKPTPVFLLGKFHGQRSLEGYSPWGLKRVRYDLVTKQWQHTNTHTYFLSYYFPL